MTETNPKVRTNIYLEKTVHDTFKQICKREGEAMSVKIEKYIRQYNQAHSAGNPQLKISVYAKPEESQPMRVLCLFVDGALSDGRVHCRKAGMWLAGVRCYSCDLNRLRKK